MERLKHGCLPLRAAAALAAWPHLALHLAASFSLCCLRARLPHCLRPSPHPRQVTYLPLDEAGAEQVMRLRQRAGQAPAALPDRAASAGRIEVAPDGQTPQQAPAELPQQLLHPLVQRMLQSGLLQVGVPRAQGMLAGRPAGVSGYIKPYYKVSVKVGGREAQTDAAQSNRQGVVEFSRPAALHLEPEAVGEEGAQGAARYCMYRLAVWPPHACCVPAPLSSVPMIGCRQLLASLPGTHICSAALSATRA
jgi:hypothetical protein